MKRHNIELLRGCRGQRSADVALAIATWRLGAMAGIAGSGGNEAPDRPGGRAAAGLECGIAAAALSVCGHSRKPRCQGHRA